MSEEEFSTLRRISVATGARSVSDLAREAMRGLLNGTSQQSSDAARNEYFAQMRDLEQKVDKLSAEIELFKADRNLSGTLLGAGTRKNEG
jgi:phage host-nuclease inhibitor protein Gam